MATNNNKMKLNTVDFRPTVFTPIEYKPIAPNDHSLLKQAFDDNDKRRIQTEQQLVTLSNSFNTIRDKVDKSEHNYINSLQKQLEDKITKAIQLGDYHSALDYSLQGAKNILDDKGIEDRMKATANYNTAISNAKKIITDPIELNYILKTNKFKFDETNDYANAIFGVDSFKDSEFISLVSGVTSTYSNTDHKTGSRDSGLDREKLYNSAYNLLNNNVSGWRDKLRQKYKAYLDDYRNNKMTEKMSNNNIYNYLKDGATGEKSYEEFEKLYVDNLLKNLPYNHHTEYKDSKDENGSTSNTSHIVGMIKPRINYTQTAGETINIGNTIGYDIFNISRF